MRRAIITLPVGAGVVLSGCATTPTPLPARILVAPSQQLRISAVRAEARGTSVRVSGRVARRSMVTGPVWGHLHIEAWSAQGLLAWKDARWSQLSRRRLPTSYFGTTLPVAAAQVQEIRISHVTASHRRRPQQESDHD